MELGSNIAFILKVFSNSNNSSSALDWSFSRIDINELRYQVVRKYALVVRVLLVIQGDLHKRRVYLVHHWRRHAISNSRRFNIGSPFEKMLSILIVVVLGICVLIKVKHAVPVFGIVYQIIIERLEVPPLQSYVGATVPRTLWRNQLSDLWPIVVPICDIARSKLLVVE